jgi:fatty-acyl-CoA synthase
MDKEGYFRIEGRLKDMVIRGGENIYPREIEEYLHHHEKIADVYVVGVPDIKYGEELCAWVKMKPGQIMTEQDVKDFCKGKIANYKIPRYVMFVNDFPINISGKIQKYKMRKESIKVLNLHEADKIETA